jgi:two-component sensor histidine kinase
MEIEITDTGAGYVPEEARQGLGTMLLRMLTGEAGAAVSIDSRPGAGTTATVRFSRAVRISDRAA